MPYCPSCPVIGTRIILKLSTYAHRLLAGKVCSAAIPKPKRKKYSYFEIINLKIEKVLGEEFYFLLLYDNCRKAGFRREHTEKNESFFQTLPHPKFPSPFLCLFSPCTPCGNSPLVSKIKMVSPVLVMLLCI